MSFNPKYLELNKIKSGGMHKKEETNISFKLRISRVSSIVELYNAHRGKTNDELRELILRQNQNCNGIYIRPPVKLVVVYVASSYFCIIEK